MTQSVHNSYPMRMKRVTLSIARPSRLLALVGAGCALAQLASAAPYYWNGASGVDFSWATGANWTPAGPPLATDTALFGADATVGDNLTVNNTIGGSRTIASLTYSNAVNGTWHVTEVPVGQTLTVSGNLVVGGGTGNGAPTLISLSAMTGGGNLVVNGTSLTVGNTGTSGGLNGGSTLDLTGLTDFIYNAASGVIGIGSVNRSTATLNLASGSNYITAATINLNTGSSSSSGSGIALRLGAGTNRINVGTLNIAANRTSATAQFAGATGGLRLRGVGGTDSDRANMVLGLRNAGSSGGGTTTGTLALNGHRVDMMIGTLTLGQMTRAGTEANLNGNGVFQFDDGVVDVTALNMAVCSGNSPTAGANGTMTVGTAGILNVGNISMANLTSTGTGANATGNLNISGGVVNCAGNIFKSTLPGVANITMTGGTLNPGPASSVGTAAVPIDNLNVSDATLQLSPKANATNFVVTTLTTGGAGNVIAIDLMPSITSYPATFRLISYQGGVAGNGYNFTLTGLPGAYTGSLVDNSVEGTVDLVITDGPVPQVISWNGDLNGNWDKTTKNWKAGAASTNFNDGDFATFDDTAAGTKTVNLVGELIPGSLTVNSAATYTFGGSGGISGLTGLTKQGSGTLIFANSGVNDFGGAISINAGSLQVGNGGTSGSLGTGAIDNNGSIAFNRSDDFSFNNAIGGSAAGTLTKNGSGVLTLGGVNTFTGAVTVAQGTLKTGSAQALGHTNGVTTIASGAVLDVAGQNLGAEPVTVSGAGSGAGAIINSGAQQLNALRYVTLAGNTTFGNNPGRWDLRGAPSTADPANAALSTGGNPYTLTKVGTNAIALVGVTVDPALADIHVQEGILGVETATTGLGNPASTLTVHPGATLRFFNMTNWLNKQFVLNGTGTNSTLDNGAGANVVVGPMTLNGAVVVTAGGTSLTLSNAISGSGSLIKSGTATLVLDGAADSYSGGTTVSNGTLVINNAVTGGGTLTVLTNATLSGLGSHTGPVEVGGSLQPGGAGIYGTFTSGQLTLQAGGTVALDLNTVQTAGSGVNDLLQVNGNLVVNGNTINLNLPAGSLTAGTYRLINYTGTLSGSFNPTVNIGGISRYGLTIDTATPGQVNLVVTGGAGSLVWTGLNGTAWDVFNTENWMNTATTLADKFYQGDRVRLDDTALGYTIDLSEAVAPSSITNDSANFYTINGPGRITGGASIVKRGPGTLTISSTNDFSGTVLIQDGTLNANNNAALGSTVGGTIIQSGGTLDVGSPTASADNTRNLGLEPISVSGLGYGDAGAIVNNATRPEQNAVRVVTLTGHARFGGNARWDIRGTGAALSTGGNAYNISKVGGNQVSLVGVAVDPALGDIDIQSGIFSIETTTSSAGNPAKTITVQPGATLMLHGLAVPLEKVLVLNGDGGNNTFRNNSGANVIAGPVTLNNGVIFSVVGTSLTVSNSVGGPGSLTKNDGSPMTLAGPVSYSGDTTVNGGILRLIGNSSISASPVVTLATGTTLDVSGRTDGKHTVTSSRSLVGLGRVWGSLQVNPGGTLAPGNEFLGVPIGTLTVTNVVTLGGTNAMQTDKSSLTNDLVAGADHIAYGGVLRVSDQFAFPYADGDAFKLFDAASYSGAFASIEPANPGPGLYWDVSQLATSGTLRVVSTPQPPAITSVSRSGGNLVLSGTGGVPNSAYHVLTSIDVALPLANWTSMVTNNFDANGNFSFQTPIDVNTPKRFFLLRLP